jgi:hypothetical protein
VTLIERFASQERYNTGLQKVSLDFELKGTWLQQRECREQTSFLKVRHEPIMGAKVAASLVVRVGFSSVVKVPTRAEARVVAFRVVRVEA